MLGRRTQSRQGPKSRRIRFAIGASAGVAGVLVCTRLAVSVGYNCAATADAQEAADRTALAAAHVLQQGKAASRAHQRQEPMKLESPSPESGKDQAIDIGAWDSRYRKFQALPPEDWDTRGFAVRVQSRRPRALASLFGFPQASLARSSVAVGSRACKGIWGLEGVRIEGRLRTDSYASQNGPYGIEQAGRQGDLCSGRGIWVEGDADIRGEVMAGLGYPVSDAIRPALTGVTTDYTERLPTIAFHYESITENNENHLLPATGRNGNPIRSGNHLVLGPGDEVCVPPGRYHLATVTAHASSTMRFSGKTVVLVTGNIEAAGAQWVNGTKDPRDLTIACTGRVVDVGGKAELLASVIAPKAEIRLRGPGDVCGAVLGRTVVILGDVPFHADESMPELVAPPPPFVVQ